MLRTHSSHPRSNPFPLLCKRSLQGHTQPATERMAGPTNRASSAKHAAHRPVGAALADQFSGPEALVESEFLGLDNQLSGARTSRGVTDSDGDFDLGRTFANIDACDRRASSATHRDGDDSSITRDRPAHPRSRACSAAHDPRRRTRAWAWGPRRGPSSGIDEVVVAGLAGPEPISCGPAIPPQAPINRSVGTVNHNCTSIIVPAPGPLTESDSVPAFGDTR
jgi:hypothetical protein